MRNLLVAYDPSSHVGSDEQSLPLEAFTEPVSGGDGYYEDFTAGLRKFVEARASARSQGAPVQGGAAGGVFVLSLGGRESEDSSSSDDELDADGALSLLDYTTSAVAADDAGTAEDRVGDGSSDLSASSGVRTPSDEVKSLLAYVHEVGGPEVHGSHESKDSDEQEIGDVDDELENVSTDEDGDEDEDIRDDGASLNRYVVVRNDDNGADTGDRPISPAAPAGEMDESELEQPPDDAEVSPSLGAGFLSSVVDVDAKNVPGPSE